MQKLIRRSPSGPVLCTVGKSSLPPLSIPFATNSFLSLGFNRNRKCSSTNNSLLCLGFNNNKRQTSLTHLTPSPPQPPMAAATTLYANPSTGGCNLAAGPKIPATALSTRILSTNTSRACPCLEVADPLRAWVVLKENRIGSRMAWFNTASSNRGFTAAAASSGADEGLNNLKGTSENGSDEVNSSGEGVALISEDKPSRAHRRQKASTSDGMELPANPDLLTIPGVGPRNLRKLVNNGIEVVADLKQLYKDKFFGKSTEKMVEFLQGSVGIIHKNHAESITTFIKERVDEELKDSPDRQQTTKKRLTFCVEGNISVGKTTFLQRIANETLELQDLVEIVPEPIDKWQDIGPDHFNILNAFYAEPQRYAYTFQNYVFVTRVMQERESSGGIRPLRLMERSVFSDRMVFVRAVHEAKWMNEMEISIYDSWFDPVVSCLPGLIPDAFIYLRASPDTCHERMIRRKRAEEGGVSLDYLRDLHEKHESWMFPHESGNHGVLSISKMPNLMDCSSHPHIKDSVFYLEGDHMHSSIQKVPALVLDCEPNIDFNRDIEAKREYARQIADFFDFVKKTQEDSAEKKQNNSQQLPGNNLLLPGGGGLWVPPALQSLDFKQAAMSFMSGSSSSKS